ncbi:MAG: PAS domain-containing methyl-accepting chemotaxis protein [Pseudomonadota bacterium]
MNIRASIRDSIDDRSDVSKIVSGTLQDYNVEDPASLEARLDTLIAENAAVSGAFACISFLPDGTIIEANDNFLKAMGYTADEVRGKHHRIFVDPEEAQSKEYREFWAELAAGKAQSRRFRRLSKQHRNVFIQASYMPVREATGAVRKIVKYASDITDAINKESANQSKLNALTQSQAVIEFTTEGHIVAANDNFLRAMGYQRDELRGKHHRIFMPDEEAETQAYKYFWERLAAGESETGEVQRVAKNGASVWLQASYNPLRDALGRVTGVIKFATDITPMVQVRDHSYTVGKSVAESAAQMGDTISEISENLNRTAAQASSAETLSRQTSEAVGRLSEGSQVIQDVVGVIRDLSEQTKLLALNASIESARAGEAGRGFAVVAGEVKELARQTREATLNIAQSVEAIRSTITQVVGSAEQISGSIAEVNSNMTNIAAAVEEQSVTMQNLNRTASELTR